MVNLLNKFKTVLILSCITFSMTIHAIELTPKTFTPDFQKKPTYGCQARYGKLACKWEGECADLGGTCASCIKGYRYSGALNECYLCPSGYSLNSQLMCS